MKVLEFSKQLKIIDLIVLFLDEKGYSDAEIATIADISTQTLHATKKRLQPFCEALKLIESPPAEYGNKDINDIVNAFAKVFGNTKTTKYDRFASKRLADKYTSSEIVKVINALSLGANDKYCPVVNSVSQLETKLPNIISYFKKKSSDQIINL
jgi:hypothetical protein